MIEVFVRSCSLYMDVETARDLAPHSLCAPGAAEGFVSEVLSKFKGRVLPEEDSKALERVLQTAGEAKEPVRVYDVSRATDRLRAVKRGIRNTPTVIINGEKYDGLGAVLQALSANRASKTPKS